MPITVVTTVLGEVPADQLGITDAHTHAWIERIDGADPGAPHLADEALLLAGLGAYAQAGGGAIVDCQPGGCGRDGNRLAWLSSSSGIHIIACTGFHRRRYYGPDPILWQMSAYEASVYFTGEIRNGLQETRFEQRPVRPGFIKIAAEKTLAESPGALFEAAAEACRQTNLAIEMHTERGAGAEQFLAFFTEREIPPTRLVFCHMDKRPDFGLHRELAEAGVMLEYDTFFRPFYQPEDNVWPLLSRMIAAGLAPSVVLATDMAPAEMWQQLGPVAFLAEIGARLERLGVESQTGQQLLGGNIARRLAINDTQERTP